MADWIIRRGIPLALFSGLLAAAAISRGNPTLFFSDVLNGLRSAIVELTPRIL